MSRWFPEQILLRVGDGPPGPDRLAAVLAAFECELDRRALPGGTRITCVVAGDAARYRIVPWNDDLTSPAQRQLLAAHCFKEAYGEVAGEWTVRLHPARHGAAALACALDARLLDRLDALARARRLRLVSVQPSLMHAYNEMPPDVGGGLFWYVCIEAVWTTVLLMSAPEPLHVKQMPSAHLDLALALDREWFALGLDGPRCAAHVRRSDASGLIRADVLGVDAPAPAHRQAA